MITTSRAWTFLTQINVADRGGRSSFGRTAGAGMRIPKRRRASLLSIIALRLCVAASVCLVTEDAMATGDVTTLSLTCAAADLRFMTLIEAHGEAQDVAAEILVRSFLTVLKARKACNEGQVEAGIKLYESIPLGPGISRGQ